MPTSLTSPADIVNFALRKVGITWDVGHLYDGSAEAQTALAVYAQTRDALLREKWWPFARRGNVALTLLKGPPPAGGYNPLQPWAPTYPPPGYLYEYLYPSDCIKIGAIIPAGGPMFDLDPKPAVFRIDNDNSLVTRAGTATTPQKVILTNVPSAMAVYIGQVTDPILWEPGFTMALIDKLATILAVALPHSVELAKAEEAETVAQTQVADMRQG